MVGRKVVPENVNCESVDLNLKHMGGGEGMLRAPCATWGAGGGLGEG